MNLKLLYRALRYRFRIDPNEINLDNKDCQEDKWQWMWEHTRVATYTGCSAWLERKDDVLPLNPKLQLFERLG